MCLESRLMIYPFTPKSSRKLSRGDFWAIPLSNGNYFCGRVVELMPKGMPGAGVGFLGGVLDWFDTRLPSNDAIAGSAFLSQGVMHIKAITFSGGQLLGNRPLELDGLEAFTFISGNEIKRGFLPIRKWKRSDKDAFPTLQWWGYDVAEIIANKHFSGSTEGCT